MSDVSRILLAEPSPASRRLLKTLLGSQRYEVVPVSSGEELLRCLQSIQFDLVLLAFDLPGSETTTLIKELQTEAPNCPVILLGTGSDPDEELRSVRLGIYDILRNAPVDAPRVIAVVRRAIMARLSVPFAASGMSQEVWAAGDREGLTQRLVGQAAEILKADTARVLAPSVSGEFVVAHTVTVGRQSPSGRSFDLTHCGELYGRDDRESLSVQRVIDPGAVNGMLVPLKSDGVLSGFFTAHRSIKSRQFTDGELEHGVLLAAMIQLALDRDVVSRDLAMRSHTLQRAWKRIVEAQRLETMGRQAASIALEMQNPISYIEGHLSVLSEYLDSLAANGSNEADFASARSSLGEVLSGVHRIGLSASELTRLARFRDDVEFELSKAVDAAIRICESLRSEVVVRVDDVVLKGNLGKFSQALSHLLSNADQSMIEHDRPKIEIRTRPTRGDRVKLEIEDYGDGISAEHLARITEPFYSTRDDEQGMGLGLSTARDVVEQLGGQLEIRSVPGKGTTIILDLPIIGAEEEIIALGD